MSSHTAVEKLSTDTYTAFDILNGCSRSFEVIQNQDRKPKPTKTIWSAQTEHDNRAFDIIYSSRFQ